VIFGTEIIPPPLALPTTTASAFESSKDVIHIQKTLEQLSAGATSAENASKRCQQTLRQVQKLLDPASLTQFKFRKPESKILPVVPSNKAYHGPVFSSFAKMVFENTNVDYRFLTPDSPTPKVRDTPIDTQITRCPVLPSPEIGYWPERQNEHPTPSRSGLLHDPQSSRLPAVVVPPTLTSAKRVDDQPMPEEGDTIAFLSRGAVVEPANRNLANGYRPMSVDQKQKDDAVVQNLKVLLSDIFEAEDQLQPDTSGVTATNSNAMFMTRETDSGSIPILHSDVQTKLDVHVHKVVTNGRLERIDTDTWIHTQRLCEGAISVAESLNLKIGEDWFDEDAQEWAARLATAEKAIVASCTQLRIMATGSHIKELQSEEYFRSILTALKNVVENCVVLIVEERPYLGEKLRGVKEETPSNPKFILASMHRRSLQSLFHATTKVFRTLGEFLAKTQVDEARLSSVQYLCKLLIFAENSTNDRESIVGSKNFETTRKCAMDVLAKIFVHYFDQRQTVLQDILMSLETLPANKQSARQFNLPDAKPIQLVSALLMRLVQSSATYGCDSLRARCKAVTNDENDNLESGASVEDGNDEEEIKMSPKKIRNQPEGLASLTKPLNEAAQGNASITVEFLLRRALTTSKSSDEPHRKLLDIFTEDFLNVIGSSDWPAAELLLRTLVLRMIGLIDNPKSAVPSRNLALEILGVIASGILGLQAAARNSVCTISDESKVGQRLADLVQQLQTGDIEHQSLIAFDGPYRMVIEYLLARNLDDGQLRSAQSYHLMQWGIEACNARGKITDPANSKNSSSIQDLHDELQSMVVDGHWLEEHCEFPQVSTTEGRLASVVVTLSSKLCRAFNKIFSILLSALSSEHSTVKSRALKSILTVLEKDFSVLDRNVYILSHILRCSDDPSPLVRDSALKLIEDCTRLRPALDKAVYEKVIVRTRDAAHGVRKRAMKMLKDIYLRNDSMILRSAIANSLIVRINDTEESVADIARQTIEEIWFIPLHDLKFDATGSVEVKLRYGDQAALLIRTIQSNEGIGNVLEGLIVNLLTRSKHAAAHFSVCSGLVKVLFDDMIDDSGVRAVPDQASILQCIALFGKASPRLFNAGQLELLEPYTQNLTHSDDLLVYRSAVTILRSVMPYQPMVRHDFLQQLQTALLKSVAKLQSAELAEVVPCLWTINGMLGNVERLVKFVTSALNNVFKLRSANFNTEPQLTGKASKLITIVGQFGNACEFDGHLAAFKDILPSYKGNSVAGLMVEVLCPFTSPKQPLPIREVSLEAVCSIAQAWPKVFLRPDVVNAFETAFKDQLPSLEVVLLTGLEKFFSLQDTSKSNEELPELGTGISSGNARLGKTYLATDKDGASTSIAQRFLQQILRLALSSTDELGVVAAKLIVSINSQGLVHPKESGPALVALETCPDSSVANLAFSQHKEQHSKHESLFDKEYMRAVQQAFDYQKDTLGSPSGYIMHGQSPSSKLNLLWEVLKTGKAQVRKKFLINISQKLDFNPAEIDNGTLPPPHLLFVRFCVENLAFFEYDRIEELLHLLAGMEKVFSGTGTAVAQSIESEVLKLRVDLYPQSSDAIFTETSETLAIEPATISADVNTDRLQQLAASAQICSLVWETRSFLRRLWNMQKYGGKSKGVAKESNKAPSRATNASALSEAYIKRVEEIMAADKSQETQQDICRSFVDLISVDREIKVASDDDETALLDHEAATPSESSGRKSPSAPLSGGDRVRKRKTNSISGTPRKKGRPSAGRGKSGSAKLIYDDGEDDGWD